MTRENEEEYFGEGGLRGEFEEIMALRCPIKCTFL